VIDDEPMVGRAIRRALDPEHDTTVASRADIALQRIQAGERFDVILCDLMMPETTGADLHAELLRVAPDQAARMVFLTGGAFTPGARAFLDKVPNPCVDKPFDARKLRAIINERT
jgi:CheY-like chemotaxis protein